MVMEVFNLLDTFISLSVRFPWTVERVKLLSSYSRMEFTKNTSAQEYNIDGVIDVNLKFCTLYDTEGTIVERALKEAKILVFNCSLSASV